MAKKQIAATSDTSDMKTLMQLDPGDPRAAEIMKRICVPHATSATGAQDGVMPPWAVKYPKSKQGAKQLSGDEAIRKYIEKRSLGEVPYPVDAKNVQIGENKPGDLDPFLAEDPKTPEVEDEEEQEEEKPKRRRKKANAVEDAALTAVAQLVAAAIGAKTAEKAPEEPKVVPESNDVLGGYLKKRTRVRMKLSTGTVNMSVIDVVPDTYSITLILPMSDDGFMFTPDPGSDVELSWQGETPKKCYFPGSQFEIPALKLMGMVFMCDLSNEDTVPAEPVKKAEVNETAVNNSVYRDRPVPKKPEYKYNPETGFMEDEFGLVKV